MGKKTKKHQRKEENKKEVQELIEKFEDDVDFDLNSDSDDSTSESEDDTAEALTSKIDKGWFRTLAALKTNDPKLLDKNAKFYDTSSDEEPSEKVVKPKKVKKSKPFLLKDYHQDILINKNGIIDENEDEIPSTSREQQDVRDSLRAAMMESDEENSDENLLKRREEESEEEEEEEEYIDWLKGKKKSLEKDKDVKKDLKPLKKLWNKPDLDQNEKFLADFFLNKRYIFKKSEERLPTYEEIVNEEKVDISQFLGKYKHRHQEPGSKTIKSYPRVIVDSVRRKDTRRADKNREVRERKIRQKEEKKKEINKLKAVKRKEIMEKIKKLKKITGNENVGFTEEALEEDFDPKKHDKMMAERFNEQYYDEGEEEAEKPVFEDDENEDFAEAGDEAGLNEELDYDDPNFNMDADYDPDQDLRVGKKKKKSKFLKAVKRKKPLFDPDEQSFPEYFDEYYKLDFEDVIGDLTCRYKYRKTEPNDFGLSVEEILTVSDKELNKWAPTQKVIGYLTKEEEKIDKKMYIKRGKSLTKKLNLMPGLRESLDPELIAEEEKKQQEKQKVREEIERKKKTADNLPSVSRSKLRRLQRRGQIIAAKGKKNQNDTEFKKEKKKSDVQKAAQISDNRAKAYGYDPRKLHYLKTDNKKRS